MSLEIRVARATSNPIARDHLSNGGAIRSFLSRDPGSLQAFSARAEAVDARFADRSALRDLVSAPSEASTSALDRVVAGGGYLVTTGHQPGLFGGPLMGLYKMLSAVRLARDLEEAMDAPVAPAFWVASDDHDWDEARRTWLLDSSNTLVEIALPPGDADAARPAMADRPLGPAVREALDALEGALPETDFSAPLLAALREAYTPEATVAGAFEHWFGALAGRLGVLFVDPAGEATRAASEPILLAELAAAERQERRLADRSTELVEAGYHAQIPVLEGGTNLHLAGPAGRERLFRDGDRFRMRASGTVLDGDEVRERARQARALSAGVGLRPVLESAILPTLAYVGGPAEVAYFAQIEPLFAEHDLEPPIVVPRFSVTLVEGKVGKVLDRFDLEPADFDRPAHEIAARVLRDELPEDVAEALKALRGSLGEAYARLGEAVKSVDPTLSGAVASARNAALGETREIEKRIARHAEDRRDIAIEQLRKAEVNLVPGGKPQERVLNALQYLARYGPGLLDDVLAAMGSLVGAPAGR
ncbi:MAG TPA: bacillithiol biosynthesis cysteine-adding enzyme BshC [Longimicrobiales bacterium]|nr:bacillithiol biosynthesis cysteine-adding enzyme BshC [Longimicrobiales bacterium]